MEEEEGVKKEESRRDPNLLTQEHKRKAIHERTGEQGVTERVANLTIKRGGTKKSVFERAQGSSYANKKNQPKERNPKTRRIQRGKGSCLIHGCSGRPLSTSQKDSSLGGGDIKSWGKDPKGVPYFPIGMTQGTR